MWEPARRLTPRIILVALATACFTSACDANHSSAGDQIKSTKPGACAGATAKEAAQKYNPRILRGRVLAPFGKLAMRSAPRRPSLQQQARSPFPDWLVASAEAAPLVNERTVPHATVQLYEVGPGGKKTGKVLRQAVTDVKGQWCMKLPDGVDPSSKLMAEATADDTRLRRSVVSPIATNIYSGTEALTRLLQQQKVDFTKIPTSTYLNMDAIADTTFDLLYPVKLKKGDNVASAVGQIQKVLAKDKRLHHKIAKLPKRTP